MIVERYGCFGGVITTVGMETLGWYRYQGTTADSEGIGREMERVARRMGGSTKWPYNDSECLDAEQFKRIADVLLEEAGVRPRLHTFVVDAVVRGGAITGVLCESKSGREAIVADRVVDCSGDADVAFHAGARFTSLDKGKRMGCTAVFNVAGVDRDRFERHVAENPATYKARQDSAEDFSRLDARRRSFPRIALRFRERTGTGTGTRRRRARRSTSRRRTWARSSSRPPRPGSSRTAPSGRATAAPTSA